MTYREAGEKLGISAQAIGMYNKNIREKMMIIEPSKQIPSKKGNINL